MKTIPRRQFIAAAGALAAGAATSGAMAGKAASVELPPLVHVAYFWLNRPDSVADRDALIEGLETLRQIELIEALHIGVPASTEKRDVVDNSFQVSELMLFKSVEAQNSYQAHPVHKAFVEKYGHLWRRVVVYDSIAV